MWQPTALESNRLISWCKSQLEGDLPPERQRHIIPGHINFLESVVPFKVGQAVLPLLPDRKNSRTIDVGSSDLRRSEPPGLLMHSSELYLDIRNIDAICIKPSLASILAGYKLNKANHVAFEKCANKDASIHKSRFHTAQSMQVLPIVPEAVSLADSGIRYRLRRCPLISSSSKGTSLTTTPFFAAFRALFLALKSICFVIQSSKEVTRRAAKLSHSVG